MWVSLDGLMETSCRLNSLKISFCWLWITLLNEGSADRSGDTSLYLAIFFYSVSSLCFSSLPSIRLIILKGLFYAFS